MKLGLGWDQEGKAFPSEGATAPLSQYGGGKFGVCQISLVQFQGSVLLVKIEKKGRLRWFWEEPKMLSMDLCSGGNEVKLEALV
jgi:hypothetical protein